MKGAIEDGSTLERMPLFFSSEQLKNTQIFRVQFFYGCSKLTQRLLRKTLVSSSRIEGEMS
jgi:hypothetical protein